MTVSCIKYLQQRTKWATVKSAYSRIKVKVIATRIENANVFTRDIIVPGQSECVSQC